MTSQTSRTGADADGLCSFVDSSPSPFHVCATVATELTGRRVRRSPRNAVVASRARTVLPRARRFADRLEHRGRGKRRSVPDCRRSYRQAPTCGSNSIPTSLQPGGRWVGLEPYGGAWLNSWLDRDPRYLRTIECPGGKHCGAEAGFASTTRFFVFRSWLIHLSEDRKGVDAGSAEARQRNLGRGFEAQVVHRLCRRACGCSRVVGFSAGN